MAVKPQLFAEAGAELYQLAVKHEAFAPMQLVSVVGRNLVIEDGAVWFDSPPFTGMNDKFYGPGLLTLEEAVLRLKEAYPSLCKTNINVGIKRNGT